MNNSLMTNRNTNYWSPFIEFRNEMDQLLDDNLNITNQTWQPPCDVVEDQDHYLLSLEMAGIPKDQIKIEIQDKQLVIKGERRAEETKNDKGVKYIERQYGKFLRSFSLPAGLDTEKIEANYQDGVLRVLVPKVEEAKPKQIKIGSGSSASFFGNIIGKPSTNEKAAS